MYKYDKDELKENLTIEQVFELVAEFGGEPQMHNNFFVSKTICHNHIGEGSYKLYYYDNTKLFKCYTDCDDAFDIYELVRKQKIISTHEDWSLLRAISYVAYYFGFSEKTFDFQELQSNLEDWEKINNYERIKNIELKDQTVELKEFNDNILKNLPHPRIIPWEKEGIKKEILNNRGIAYDPKNQGIVIPHYDINERLIGIRERTLIKEEEQYGKYKPAILNGKIYNHPIGYNLYNINNSKNHIKEIKKAIVFEGKR